MSDFIGAYLYKTYVSLHMHTISTQDRPFEYRTIWNPNFKKFGIQMVGIQILSVFYFH